MNYINTSYFKHSFIAMVCCFIIALGSQSIQAVTPIEKIELWPNLAPGITEKTPNVEDTNSENAPAIQVTAPYLLIQRPEKQTSDACILIMPGGGFNVCFYKNEGFPPAEFWNSRGYVTAVLVYRVPRPQTGSIYLPALQDAQRAIRILRGNAAKYGISKDRIGAEGYSAGGCLTLLAAVNSNTQTYDPVDELDKIPCNLNFAIPVYPAYVLDDGATDPNVNKGENASILPDFHFDSNTPPMCLIHGDGDIYSPLGSLEVYKTLRRMGISAELHIFSNAPHGYMFWDNLPNAQSWQDRRYAWLKKMGY